MKTLVAVVVALACSACVTRGGFEKTMNSYLGASESSLVSGMGPPMNVYAAPDGARILTYAKNGNMQLGGGTTIQPTTSSTTGNIYGSSGGSANYRSTTTTYQAVQQPTYNVALSCTVNFTLRNGVVVNWQANGNHCVN